MIFFPQSKAQHDADMEALRSQVEKLTEQQLVEIREAFNLYDIDQDGVIGTTELKDTLTSLGQDPTDVEIKEMMAKVDLDGKHTQN